MNDDSRRVALVLSGGGALGAAHLGALGVLEKAGYSFNFLCGTSAGAIAAGLLACGIQSEAAWKLLKKTKLFRLAFDPSPLRSGLLRGDRVLRLFHEHYGEKRIEDLPIPLVIVATDFQTGEKVLIRTGKISDAVRASISVPILFEPYFHPELKRWLVDGGIVQNLPVDTALEEYQGKRIIAVDVASTIDNGIDFSKRAGLMGGRLVKPAVRAMRIIFKNQLARIPLDERVLMISPDTAAFSALSIFRLDALFECGEKATRAALKRI